MPWIVVDIMNVQLVTLMPCDYKNLYTIPELQFHQSRNFKCVENGIAAYDEI